MHVDKIDKDRRVLEAMGSIYCQGNHSDAQKDEGGMCPEVPHDHRADAFRAASCPYGHEGNCQDCKHTVSAAMLTRIRAIMRYAAPRMMVRHPIMVLEYLRKKLRA